MNEPDFPPPPVVLLTATVRPNVDSYVSIADPDVRLAQYRSSIRRWLSMSRGSFELAIVETSGASVRDLLSGLPLGEATRVRFHSYKPQDQDVVRGKGAIELAAIGSAIEDFVDLEPEATVIKVTGRLVLVNCDAVVAPTSPDTIVARATLNRAWVDTRLLSASKSVWRDHLVGARELIDDDRGVFVERAIAARIAGPVTLGELRLARFPERPILEGYSGSTGARYPGQAQVVRARILQAIETRLTKLAARKQA